MNRRGTRFGLFRLKVPILQPESCNNLSFLLAKYHPQSYQVRLTFCKGKNKGSTKAQDKTYCCDHL